MKKIAKILLILGIIVAAGAIGYFGWQYLFGNRAATSTPEEQIGELIAKPKVISENTVFDYWVDKGAGSVYYISSAGQLYKIDSATGDNQDLGSQTIGNLSYIKPSFDGSLVMVAFGYPQNPTFAIHNLSKKSWQSLPAGTTAAAWDPKSNNRIAYLKDNGGASRLSLLTLNNQRTQEILRLNQKDLDLDWVLPDLIYFKERASVELSGSVWLYSLSKKTFKPLVREANDLSLKWSADGKLGIKWSDGLLSVVDGDGGSLGSTEIKTLPTKCGFAESLIYCAAPDEQENLSNRSWENYRKKVTYFSDNIYAIPLLDLNASAKLIYFSIYNPLNDAPIDADHLEIQGDGRLLFINRLDNKLYSLDL